MKHKLFCIILWTATIFWLILCFFLSWQTGEATGKLSQRLAKLLIALLNRVGITPDPQQFHANLRLFAHVGVFFVTGVLLASVIVTTFPQSNRFVLFSMSAVLCAIIAVFAEVGKLNVPGRHLTWSEAGLNVLGAVCGIACMTGIRALLRHLR